jgi:hypothetical protein
LKHLPLEFRRIFKSSHAGNCRNDLKRSVLCHD